MDSSYATLTAHPGGGQALPRRSPRRIADLTSAALATRRFFRSPFLAYNHVKNGAAANAMNILPQSAAEPADPRD